jgi:hypothetical protein
VTPQRRASAGRNAHRSAEPLIKPIPSRSACSPIHHDVALSQRSKSWTPIVERHLTTNLNSNPDGVTGNCKFNSAVPRGPPSRGEIRSHGDTLAAQWAALDEHFQNHAKLVERFRDAGPEVVARMWMSQTNEGGHSVSQFERDALIERHCELFGTWPDLCPPRNAARSGLPAAELEHADL